MAITVRDIRSKQFTSQRNGYNKDEVDDFLDELADQLEEIIKENLSLAKQLKERPVVESEPVVIEKPVEVVRREEPKNEVAPVTQADSAYDEPSYFKNLETTLRETLINAQRIGRNRRGSAQKVQADGRLRGRTGQRDAGLRQGRHRGRQERGG